MSGRRVARNYRNSGLWPWTAPGPVRCMPLGRSGARVRLDRGPQCWRPRPEGPDAPVELRDVLRWSMRLWWFGIVLLVIVAVAAAVKIREAVIPQPRWVPVNEVSEDGRPEPSLEGEAP